MNDDTNNKIIYPVFIGGNEWCNGFLHDKGLITKISFVAYYDSDKIGQSLTWDVSEAQEHSIVANLINNGTEIVISDNGNGKIQMSSNMSRMFADFENLEQINGLDILDTSNVTDMSYLFHHCVSLKALDLSAWDVSNVKSFRGTFCCGHNQVGDAALSNLNIDMAYMFYGCGKIKHIDVSKWDTTNVTNFRHTFADCFELREIAVSNWDTCSVITLDGIFNDCRKLKCIDISNWDTSSCQEFDQMFDNCISLIEIKGLNNLNTSEGISFEEMFFGCQSLKSLDLSAFDTSHVDGHEFTAYNSSIKSISNMKKMLAGCSKLQNLQIGKKYLFNISGQSDFHLLQVLNDVGYIVITPETGSMKPMLHEKKHQAVFIKKNKYQRNDIVLFKSDFSSNLVMHRIRRVLSQGYIICGDNSRYSEFVFKDNVYAYASEIHKEGQVINRDSLQYKWLSAFTLAYNWLYFNYKKNNGIFWKIARKFNRTFLKGKK